MVFDFRGKNVEPTLAIKSPYGRSAVVDKEEEEETEANQVDSLSVPSFIGGNQVIGKGILLKKRNKKLSISFCPEERLTTVFEYPSKSCYHLLLPLFVKKLCEIMCQNN